MNFFKKKEKIPIETIGLYNFPVGKDYDILWEINLDNKYYSTKSIKTFKIHEVKRFENNKSEIKIISIMNGEKVSFNKRTSYIVNTNEITWLKYDTIELYNELQKLKKEKTYKEIDRKTFQDNLNEFKNVEFS